jgi:hypothetical protein
MICNELVAGAPHIIRRVFQALTLRYRAGERGESSQTRHIRQFIPSVIEGPAILGLLPSAQSSTSPWLGAKNVSRRDTIAS